MRIFYYSTVFAPRVGGIETLVDTLCREFAALGHEVHLATETPAGKPGEAERPRPYRVTRQPSAAQMRILLDWCDVHLQANVSLRAAWARLAAPRKTFYQHNSAYQRDDGSMGLRERMKTAVARATPGIANSRYTGARTGARHVILNAYDDSLFCPPAPGQSAWDQRDRDMVFLGRMVTQKGADTLIDALARLDRRGHRPSLTLIGDGPERVPLERQAVAAGLRDRVRFAGTLCGAALASELARHRVMVVPSRYAEPFGIVALEGLASGCLPVVSARGGLVDAIGGHGLTFPNGDAAALADRLAAILRDPVAARARMRGADVHLAQCRARAVAERYIAVFKEHLGGRLVAPEHPFRGGRAMPPQDEPA